MALPDITGLTVDELLQLQSDAWTRAQQLQAQNEQTEAALRVELTAALATLDSLIGDGDPKGFNSIVAVRQYTAEEMAGAPQIALPLIFQGIEILARTTRDIAKVLGK